jgi:hypothetical protein
MKYIDKNNSKALLAHLFKIESDIKISELIDQDGFSLLHMSVFKNKDKSFDTIIKKAKDVLPKHEFSEWVNEKTNKD